MSKSIEGLIKEDACLFYAKLRNIKEALYFKENENLNEDEIFEIVNEQNLKEFYLLKYLIYKFKEIPYELKIQSLALVDLYGKDEEYKEKYQQIKKSLEKDPSFISFQNSISKDLDLKDEANIKTVNFIFFELGHKYLNGSVLLEPKNVCLNFHLLQKWAKEEVDFSFSDLNICETAIINLLSKGFGPEEIIKMGEDFKNSEQYLRRIIYKSLPYKFKASNLFEVMAKVFYMDS